MLTITVLGEEFWDDEAERFCYPSSVALQFEHSLVSLSKWEAEFHKLFLTPDPKDEEEMAGYVRSMLSTPGVDPKVLDHLTEENMKTLDEYINNPMSGTTFSKVLPQQQKSTERISSELIYFWMSQYKIDKECEHWHLNRLFTLIRIHHAKTQKPQKMSRQAQVQSMAELNAQRKAKMGTKG